MKEIRPDTNGPFGIESEVIDNYVRSMAGWASCPSLNCKSLIISFLLDFEEW